jgi:hypothetical protein
MIVSRTTLAMSLMTLALAAGGAVAQPADATAHYQAAEAAMAREAWAEAAREYEAAYRLNADPILLLKQGTAQARAGACDAAKATIDRYLAEGNPSPEYRAMAEERVATCQPAGTGPGSGPDSGSGSDPGTGSDPGSASGPGQFGTSPGTGAEDPDVLPSLGVGGPSFTDTPSTWKRSAGWIATGTTIGLVAVGTVLMLSAEGSEEDIQALLDFRTGDDGSERPLRWDEIDSQYTDLVDEGAKFDRLATYTFAAAGVTAAAAITFFVLDATTSSGERAPGTAVIAPQVGRQSAGVNVGWSF